MVLFTSIKALSDTSKALQEKEGGQRLATFAQIRGASKPAIIKGMHQNPNGILFGTNSFWEGVISWRFIRNFSTGQIAF